MKTNDSPPRFTRRSAFGLILAGIALPTAPALAAKDVFIRVKPHVGGPIVLTTCSGESLTAIFESDLLIGSNGAARGEVRFDFGADDRVDFVPVVGGLDFDAAGAVIAAHVLLRLRGNRGRLAQEYALLAVTPHESEDCLIYTTIGTQVHAEQVRFEVPGVFKGQR